MTDETVGLPSTQGPARSTGQADSVAAGAQLGAIRLIEQVGRGGMGAVWRGHDQLLGRDVAVKFLDAAASDAAHLEQFVAEMRAAAAVRHPNLTSIHHAELASGTPYLVMEFINGPTLREFSDRCGALPVSLALPVLEEVSAGVGALHEQGLLHRDLKPANVLLEAEAARPRVAVTDFGLALRRASVSGAGAASGQVAGTPLYMAPELHDGRPSVRSDVYALGLIAFELLTARRPFSGTAEEVREAHATKLLPAEELTARGVPPELIEVIERAAHKQVMFRYKSAGDFTRAFRHAAGQEAVAAQPQARSELARLIHQCRKSTTEPVAPTAPSGLTGSYADTLARMAAHRRDTRSHAPGPPAVIVPPEKSQGSAPGPIIDFDLPCLHCGYNLRSRHVDAVCTECGVPLSASLVPQRLLFADRRWLKRIRLALALLLITPLALIGQMLVAFLAITYHFLPTADKTDHLMLRVILLISPILLGALVLIVGAVMTTLRRPASSLPWTGTLCRATSVLLVLTFAFSIAFATANGPLWRILMSDFLLMTGPLVMAIGLVAHLGCFVPDDLHEGIFRRARRLALGALAVSLALCMFYYVYSTTGRPRVALSRAAVAAINVAVIASVVLAWAAIFISFNGIRRTLAQQALIPTDALARYAARRTARARPSA